MSRNLSQESESLRETVIRNLQEKDPNSPVYLSGDETMTIAQLIEEVEGRTPIGDLLVELYRRDTRQVLEQE